jgi:predicted AlkP superfamily pyrophosphatase or phosphodiesterase
MITSRLRLLYPGAAMRSIDCRPVTLRLTAALVSVCVLAVACAGIAASTGTGPLVLMISVDGLRPDYVTHADALGARIPNLRRFLTEGMFADGVQGVVPTVTYPSHTTLVTGVWPARHGIFANTMFDPLRRNNGAWYWFARDLRVPTLWDAAAQAGMKTASIQWPATVGARIDWNIPEFWQPDLTADADVLTPVSTPGLLAEMEALLGRYPRSLEVDADEARARFTVRLLETRRPNLFTLHLIALDHTQHETGPFSAATFAVLERLDTAIGTLRSTAERLAPGRAFVAVVSDHGFARTTRRLNPFPAFRDAGLFSLDGPRRITAWKAMPWPTGGGFAVVVNDPADQATLDAVRRVLDALAADPANGIDRILDAAALSQRGGYPPAAFFVGLRPGWEAGYTLSGPTVSSRPTRGTHGHLPDLPDLRATFLLVGPGVPAGRALGVIDMRDVAPTLARALGVALPTADGKSLLP